MSNVPVPLTAAEADALDDIYIGPAFRCVSYDDAYQGTRLPTVVEGPADLTTQFIEQRFEYYKSEYPACFRQFVGLDKTAKPPMPVVFGVCTEETEPEEILAEVSSIYPEVNTIYFEAE